MQTRWRLQAGALFLAMIPCALALGLEETEFGIVINEIHYHPKSIALPGADTVTRNADEWVEIHNVADAPRQLDGFILGGGINFKFPPGTVLPAQGYAVIAQSPDALRARREGTSLLLGPLDGRFKNSGERIELRDERGRLLDWVEYGDGPPWPAAPDGRGKTLELLHPAFDGSMAGSWAASSCEGGTPGARNSVWTVSEPPWIAAAGIHETPSQHGYPPEEPLTLVADVGSGTALRCVRVLVQAVPPGGYIAPGTTEYASKWTTVEMIRSSRSRYEAVLGPFAHRTLVRWRVEAADEHGAVASYPRKDNPVPHESFFVYSRVPGFEVPQSAFSSGNRHIHQNDRGELERVPVFFLLSRKEDLERLLSDRAIGKDYPFTGSFVYRGRVWEPVEFRTRGGATRHELKKRNLKFRFPQGNPLSGMEGSSASHTRRRLNLNRAAEHFGLHEALAYRLFGQAGIVISQVEYIHLRIIAGQHENEDFFGLYLDVEEVDARFLKRRDVSNAYLYKIAGIARPKQLGGPFATGYSEVRNYALGNAGFDWFTSHVNIPRYLTFRAMAGLTGAEDFGDRNYYLLKRGDPARWELCPSDLNGAFGVKSVNAADVFSRTLPSYAVELKAFVDALRASLLAEGNTSAILAEFIEQIEALARADEDRWRLAGRHRPLVNPESVVKWLERHLHDKAAMPQITHKHER